MMRSPFFFFVFVTCSGLLLGGCSSDERDADQLPAPPSECDALPSLTKASELLAAKLDEASSGGERLEPKNGFLGDQVPQNVGYLMDPPTGSAAPLLLRSQAEIEQNESLKAIADSFDADWSTEVLAVTRESTREASYRYAKVGTTLVAIVARATPCLAAVDSSSFPTAYPTIRVLRVPKTIDSTKLVEVEERYRMPMPQASGACKRGSAIVASGAANPSVARGPDGIRLYFGGFSAMTGNVFFGESKDGAAFTPNGWDEGHLSHFEGRGPYAEVYGASVDAVAAGWRMTAHTTESTMVTKDDHHMLVKQEAVVEMTSADGISWSKGTPLLPAPIDADSAARGPFRITVDGEERLYFERKGEIHVARRKGAAAFVEDAVPVLVPPGNLDAYDALGYGDPEVVRSGDRFLLFFTTSWGGLSRERPWRTGVGYAVSADGVTFKRAEAPLLVPELEDEADGIGAPSVLLDGDRTTVFFTSVNRNAEPVVKRADCVLP